MPESQLEQEIDTQILIERIRDRFVAEGVPWQYLQFLENIRILPERKRFKNALENKHDLSPQEVLQMISCGITTYIEENRIQFRKEDYVYIVEDWKDLFFVVQMIVFPQGAA